MRRPACDCQLAWTTMQLIGHLSYCCVNSVTVCDVLLHHTWTCPHLATWILNLHHIGDSAHLGSRYQVCLSQRMKKLRFSVKKDLMTLFTDHILIPSPSNLPVHHPSEQGITRPKSVEFSLTRSSDPSPWGTCKVIVIQVTHTTSRNYLKILLRRRGTSVIELGI